MSRTWRGQFSECRPQQVKHGTKRSYITVWTEGTGESERFGSPKGKPTGVLK